MSPKHLNNSLNEMLQIDNFNDVKCEMSRDNNDDVSKSKIEYQIIEVNDMKNTQIIELPNTVYSSNNNKNNLNFKLNEKIRLNNVNNKSPITMININLPQTQQKQQQQQSSQRYQQLLTFSTDKCKKCDKHDYQSNDNNNDVNSDITSIPIQKKMEKDKSFSHIRNSPFLTTSSFSSSCSFKPNNNNRHRKSIIMQKTNITEQQNEPLTNNIERELRREEILSVLIPKHDINIKLAHATIGENKQQGTIATTTQQITIPIPITTITMTIARTSVEATATATTTSTTTIANNVLSTLTNDITIFNENKYVCNSWYQLSNQKCLEANGSLVALTPINQFNINNRNNQQQTLAERKALLKQAFFLGFPSINATDQTSIPKREQSDIRIEKDYKEESLVAQRMRHLNEKIVKPSTFKDNVNNSALLLFGYKEFPQIKELVKKFDTASLIPKTSKTLRKATLKQIDTLKKKENMLQEQQPQPQPRQQQEKEKQQKQHQRHQQKQRQSPLSDEGCNLGHSPYSTDDDDQEIAQDDDNVSVCATQTIIENIDNKIDKMEKIPLKEKVSRSGSSDSALGLEIEEAMDAFPPPKEKQQKRRMTLTVTDIPLRPALLPLAEPTLLPDSPTLEVPLSPAITTTTTSAIGASLATATKSLIGANVPPSKILLPERVVSIPEEPRHLRSASNSRRESCFSDIIAKDQEISGVRYVRTPSVVISDYSDDALCGITLEEIEYFRAQRMRHRRSSLDTTNTIDKDDNNSDFSNASSCSNLYYCGSTISALDGNECLVNGERLELQRNISNCSSTGSLSGQDDEEDDANIHSIPEQPESEPQPETDMVDLADILSNQHLNNTRRSKKVGEKGASLHHMK